jgi:hypothetical protein
MQHRSWNLHFVEMDAEIPAITSFLPWVQKLLRWTGWHGYSWNTYYVLASIYCFKAFEVNLPAVKWFGSWLISYLVQRTQFKNKEW